MRVGEWAVTPQDSAILDAYLERTKRSAELMDHARQVMPAGSTRTFGFYEPYPLVFDHGEGVHLWDADGHRYTDFTYNGLSLIHGHAYEPVLEALRGAIANGTAWPGASTHQIEFADLLCDRIPTAEQVRFTNTGTEATMLGVKIARHATGRRLIVKFRGAYHGSYDDLEAGLYGIGELEGRTLLGEFGNLESFERVFAAHRDEIAAVVIEPILFTFRVVPPPAGFLADLIDMAHDAGILAVLDDCLMFRLAEGGSAEKYGIEPDITCLGKFVGGGLPVGVVGASAELMHIFDPSHPHTVYHGGSFNGNPLGCAAGRVAVENYTATDIARMDAQASRIAGALESAATTAGLPLQTSGDASLLGAYIVDEAGEPDPRLTRVFQMAAINRGVYIGQDGEVALATPFTDADVDEAIERLGGAVEDMAAEFDQLEAT